VPWSYFRATRSVLQKYHTMNSAPRQSLTITKCFNSRNIEMDTEASNDLTQKPKNPKGFQPGHKHAVGRAQPWEGKSSKHISKGDKLLTKLMNSRGDQFTRIVDGVMALAASGEQWAAEAVIDRMWPKPKGRPVMGLDGIAAAMDRIIAAVNAGTISPDEGLACAALLEKQADMLTARELERRLAKLEQETANADR
jgi:hypothetical protein